MSMNKLFVCPTETFLFSCFTNFTLSETLIFKNIHLSVPIGICKSISRKSSAIHVSNRTCSKFSWFFRSWNRLLLCLCLFVFRIIYIYSQFKISTDTIISFRIFKIPTQYPTQLLPTFFILCSTNTGSGKEKLLKKKKKKRFSSTATTRKSKGSTIFLSMAVPQLKTQIPLFILQWTFRFYRHIYTFASKSM